MWETTYNDLVDSVSNSPPVFDPQTWIDLLAAHAAKRDMFSAKSLVVILDGIEKLAEARSTAGHSITVTAFHTTLFERLKSSFSNPTLLKEIGLIYLGEFHLPAVALKHFELAHQFAPRDRELEQLQTTATLALARDATDQPVHTGINEAQPTKPELLGLLRQTTRLSVIEARHDLDESNVEFKRKQTAFRTTGRVKLQPAPAADFGKLLDQAKKLIRQTDFAGAADTLARAQQAGAPKEELQAYYAQLGLGAFDHGRMDEALQAFLVTRDLGPEALEGWFNCGLVYQKIGRLDEALQSYQEAARIAPDHAKIWCNISSVWFEAGNYEEAETTARRALELKPDYARAWDNLAATLSAMNKLPEAADACHQAIRLQPALHSAWFKLGVVSFQQDQMLAAKEAFNLTGDNPDFFPFILYYLSMIEARGGELDEALKKLAEARAADPGNELESPALKELGALCTRFGRHVTAADFYAQITAKAPDDFSAWLALGASQHRAEELELARQAYQRACELQPDNPLPWHNLGLLASDLGDDEKARECFQHEVQLSPDDAKAWYDLGLTFQSLGKERESAEAFERAEKLVNTLSRRSSDLSAALSIVRRLNLGERKIKE
jgi:tetratricopeptide (TPR) repeat protein